MSTEDNHPMPSDYPPDTCHQVKSPVPFQHFHDVFSDIRVFQVGCLKPTADSTSLPTFVPIFPFMYESVDYGETLRGKIRLQMIMQSQERTNLQRQREEQKCSSETDELRQFEKAEVKFTMQADSLFMHEENRSELH